MHKISHHSDDTTNILATCFRCRKDTLLTVPTIGYHAWQANVLIQDALPDLSTGERGTPDFRFLRNLLRQTRRLRTMNIEHLRTIQTSEHYVSSAVGELELARMELESVADKTSPIVEKLRQLVRDTYAMRSDLRTIINNQSL